MNNVKRERVILQVKHPIIASFTSDAHMLAILNSYPSTDEWVYNNFINLWGEKPAYHNYFPIIRFGSWLIRRACPYFKINTFYKETFDLNIIEDSF